METVHDVGLLNKVDFLLSLSYRKESNVIGSNFRWSDFSAKICFEAPRA
jgi:hypothetical protein